MKLLLIAQLVLELIQLTGPDNQVISVNPAHIVGFRAPRRADHFAPGSHCLVFTADGKYLAVVESCRTVADILHGK